MRPIEISNQQSSGRAFTLVEMLVALTLTVLLVSIVGEVAVTSQESRTQVLRHVATWEREAIVFDGIAADMAGLFPASDDQASLHVLGVPRPSMSLRTLAPTWAAAGALHVPMLPSLVKYFTVRNRNSGGLELVREVQDLSDPTAAPARETLAVGLSRFEVRVFDGQQWAGAFPAAGKGDGALAVRVTCRWSDDERDIVRTFRTAKRGARR